MFAARIESVAERLNFQVKWIEKADSIVPPAPDSPIRQMAEHMSGPGAVLLDKLTQWGPALIIFDLDNGAIPWREWLAMIKTVPSTRRIPVLCFGPHTNLEVMSAAKEAGADAVLARSRFVSEMPALIQKYASLPDYEAIENACQGQLSDVAIKGLEYFNSGDYFEAHELLEDAWNEDTTVGKELYRAILQVAVAYLQIERGNYNGAQKMFLRLRQWITPLPAHCRGVDVASLRIDVEAVQQHLLDLGPDRIGEFDRGLFHPMIFTTE